MAIFYIEVSSNSTGGTNYTDRVFRALETHDHVVVIVKQGEFQHLVYTHCKQQLSRVLKHTGKLPIQVVKQEKM